MNSLMVLAIIGSAVIGYFLIKLFNHIVICILEDEIDRKTRNSMSYITESLNNSTQRILDLELKLSELSGSVDEISREISRARIDNTKLSDLMRIISKINMKGAKK